MTDLREYDSAATPDSSEGRSVEEMIQASIGAIVDNFHAHVKDPSKRPFNAHFVLDYDAHAAMHYGFEVGVGLQAHAEDPDKAVAFYDGNAVDLYVRVLYRNPSSEQEMPQACDVTYSSDPILY